MIANFQETLEQMYQAYNQSFKAGTYWNIQLKLLERYITELADEPETHQKIDLKSKAFTEFGANMEPVLVSIGFVREGEELIYQNNIQELQQNKEAILKIMEERKYISFSEISDIIQRGEKPPGIKEINDSPIDAPASVSTMQRPLKPWESSK